jgi:uncharacterized protein involved in cysteine biosynthesis
MKLLLGPLAVVRAVGVVVGNPHLVPLALIPSFIALAVSLLAITLSVSYGGDVMSRLWAAPESGWLESVWWIARILLQLSSALLVLLVTPWLVMLVGFPLCEPLASRVDALLGGREVPAASMIADAVMALRSSIALLAVGLSGGTVLFLLGLIPGVAALTAPFVTFIWTPFFVAIDLLDSSLSRRRLGFRAKVRFALEHIPVALGLGLVCAPLISVPFLNLLGLPLAVVAGVLVVRQLEEDGDLA